MSRMAIKQRILKELTDVDDKLNYMVETGDSASLEDIQLKLMNARDMCCNGTPKNAYDKYAEFYTVMIITIKEMINNRACRLQLAPLLLEVLCQVMEFTKNEANFKKEIFFLPYKASMWDSLESVWEAANADTEHCNAYVMPIPYADRNSDGSAAKWQCERELFPKYVPLLDWQQVDLKSWHPDVIFIHNPYDGCNYVTSVDSQYYSENLKKCTDKLVYIPYFILEGVNPENKINEERVLHFVMTPGVMNADQIVVQSEYMRELYINVLMKNTEHHEREYWGKRISGMGSPKIDKIHNSKKEDFVMPEKWLELIRGKKVILYNTSLSAMLNNTENVCGKLSYVFEVFKNRDDVVLWWRPHPLMKATLHSIRPRFEEQYMRLERKYIKEGWGIYDDSPDLHRAIAWSDAYYGDMSSVVGLYRETRKSVLIQYGVPLPIENRCGPAMMDIQGDMIWFVTVGLHELCSINISTGKFCSYGNCYEPVIPINLADYQTKMCYVKAVGNRIIIIPWQGSEWVEFDLNTMEFTHIEINDILLDKNIGGCIEYKGAIFCYGIDSFIYEYIPSKRRGVIHSVCMKNVDDKNVSAPDTACVYDHKLWYAYKGSIISFDLLSHDSTLYEVPVAYGACVGITTDGDSLFVLANSGNVVIEWELSCGVKREWHLGKVTTPFIMGSMVILENVLYVVVNTMSTDCTIARINIMTGEKIENTFEGNVLLSNVFDNCVYGICANRGYICSIGGGGDIQLKYNVAMDLKKLKKKYRGLNQYSYGYENNCWGLKDWLDFLHNDCLKVKKYEPVGKKIYYQSLKK